MSDSLPPDNRRSGRRRWPRRLVYFAGWLACLVLSFVLLLGGALWLLVRNPGGVLNAGAEMVAPELGIRVAEIDVDTPGRVVLRDLSVNPEGGTEPIWLEEVSIGYSWGDGAPWRTANIESLDIRGGSAAVTDSLLERFAPRRDDAPPPSGKPLPGWLARVVPDRVEIDGLSLEVDLEALPHLETRVKFSSRSLYGLIAGEAKVPSQHIELFDGRWRGDGDEPVRFDHVVLDVGLQRGGNGIEIENFEITGLDAVLSREHLARFLDAPAEGGGEVPRITIARMTAADASLDLSGFEQLQNLNLKARVGFELHDLAIVDGGIVSAVSQELDLKDISVATASSPDAPILRWEHATLAAIPDELLAEGRIRKIHLRGLQVDVSEGTLGDLMERISARIPAETPGGAGEGASKRPPILVEDLRIEPARLSFDPSGLFEGVPAGSVTLQARTEGEAVEGDIAYVFELTDLAVRESAGAKAPFAGGGRVTAEFTALGLQRDGEIRRVEVRGVRAKIGEEVNRLAEAAAAAAKGGEQGAAPPDAPPGEAPPAEDGDADDKPDLRIVELDIDDTVFTLRDLIPDALPYLPISVDTRLDDVPLVGRSRGDEREQRIEVKGVQIANPYNTLQNVAELKTVWITFTMAGLFRKEIKRIEVVSPDLYVGEPLFWYVNYAREFAAGRIGPESGKAVASASGSGGEAGNPGEPGEDEDEAGAVPGDEAAAGGAQPDAIVEGLKEFRIAGWELGEFAAHSGRIIIAPTGVPLGIVPFPFNAKTSFAEGKMEIKVQVPTGDFTFEKLELELQQLQGEAFVNYPVASKDNNFVQTFQTPLVKFKQFEAQDVWLSVTYDQNGIYGQLGGQAYGGYVNGEFNIYVKGPFKWDAWVSGDDFDLGAFTDVLAPTQFMMSGLLDGKFVAEGQQFSIAQASGTAGSGGGTMHVLKLDDLKEALPEAWDPIWQALATASIDAFRDYHFERAAAELEYSGKEGDARIVFEGDEGVRDLQLRLHDGDKDQGGVE